MAWWNFGRQKTETAKADWVGEQLAEFLDPEPAVREVRERDHLAPDDLKPFVALASLRVAGVQIGLNQASVLSQGDKAVVVTIHQSFCSALVWKYGNKHHVERSPSELVLEVVSLANKVTGAFYANAHSQPPLPLPHWFACKEMLPHVQGGEQANPEFIMIYSEYLSASMGITKAFLDELSARNVRLVG